MKTLHLAPGHPRLDTRVFHKECRSLSSAGHEVVLVVATGEGTEQIDGIEVMSIRAPTGRVGRFLLSPFRLLRRVWRTRPDCVHVHDVEALPVGLMFALRGIPAIWDSHEDLPRLAAGRTWIPLRLRTPLSRAVAVAERLLVARYRAIISAEDEGARRFPVDRTVVVRNYPLMEEFEGIDLGDYDERPPLVAYVGDVTHQRGAVEMVTAMERLHGVSDPRLVLAGRINIPGLEHELEQLSGWARTDAVGFVARAEVMAILRRARIGVVLLHPIRKYAEGAVPVKLFEYMAAGLPVVASDLPVIRDIVAAAECGILVDPLDVDAVARALEELLLDPERACQMGERGRAQIAEHYSWESESQALLGLYGQIELDRG